MSIDSTSYGVVPPPLPDGIRRRAALVVCARAQDADDARELLLALELIPDTRAAATGNGPRGALGVCGRPDHQPGRRRQAVTP